MTPEGKTPNDEYRLPSSGDGKTPNVGDNVNDNPNTGNSTIINNLTNQLNNLQTQLSVINKSEKDLNNQINKLKEELVVKNSECIELAEKEKLSQQNFVDSKNDCYSLSVEIEMIQQQLINLENNSVSSGCTSNSEYNSLLQYLNVLKEKYKKCRENATATNITTYNTAFITQIYETNEYEGNVTVVGDNEWDQDDQLIIDCLE